MKPLDPISVIEAAYRMDLDAGAWLEGLAAATATFVGAKRGGLAFLYDAREPAWVHLVDVRLHGLPAEFGQMFFDQPLSEAEGEEVVSIFKTVSFATLRTGYFPRPMALKFHALMEGFGVPDVVCLNGRNPERQGAAVCVVANAKNYSRRGIRLWRRLGAHLAAAARLRRTLDSLDAGQSEPTERAEAILTPSGHVEHAVGPAKERRARQNLREALVRVSSVRSRQLAPERGVALWDALVAGRWSIVEHFERDGKQYYLAHKNHPELAVDRALTPVEQQVMALAELGHSNKLIAYSLGLSTSTVGSLLGRAHRKLGLAPSTRHGAPAGEPKLPR